MSGKVGEDYITSAEKRTLDIAGATLIALGTAPLVGAAAAALCLERGQFNPIFRHQRIGRHNLPFMLSKLRTIVDQEVENNFDTFKRADPSASRLGRIIRRTGIDELPQVANVLTGDISLVGIRPQLEWVLEQRQSTDPKLFDDWYYCYQHNPGLFGPGQSHAHGVGGYEEGALVVPELMKLDIDGFEHASLQNDLGIIISQPLAVIRTALAAV